MSKDSAVMKDLAMTLSMEEHVGSSKTRNQTYVSCMGRHVLYH